MTRRAKPICFYLPQFHEIPENNRWWGQGFTEWSLIKKARPLYRGHDHPVEPHPDMGYYDLKDPAIRRLQGEMALKHGVYGFCYYHYWFAGKRLLETPLEMMLKDGYPDIPFCLCWANEPWTRSWSGQGEAVLQPQAYAGKSDWQLHFQTLLPFLMHANAIQVDACPVLLIYRAGQVTNLEDMVACWREMAIQNGLPGLHLLCVLGGFGDNQAVPACLDGGAEHHPGFLESKVEPLVIRQTTRVFPVEKLWGVAGAVQKVHSVQYPGACISWDNSPRVGVRATICSESSSARVAAFLSLSARRASEDKDLPEPFVFVNAWNEWSEGAYLEPDRRNGYRRLNAFQLGFSGLNGVEFNAVPAYRPATDLSQGSYSDEVDIDALNILLISGIRAQKVLELGCRNGETGSYAWAFVGATEYCGTEPEHEYLNKAKHRLEHTLLWDIDWFGREARERNALRSGLDLVLAFDMIAHTSTPDTVLHRLYSLLRPGGYALLGFFHKYHHSSIGQRVKFDRPGIKNPFRQDLEGYAYSIEDASSMVSRAGFDIVDILKVFSPGAPDKQTLPASGGSITVDGLEFSNLHASQIENLYCYRIFFVLEKKPGARGREAK